MNTLVFDAQINFRGTEAYVADGPGQVCALGEAYPVTKGGITFGWLDAIYGGHAGVDRNNLGDFPPELSGFNAAFNQAGGGRFRVDLPRAGTYEVRMAIGEATYYQYDQYAAIYDGPDGPLLATVTEDGLAGRFIDAMGILRAEAPDWRADNQPRTVTTTGSSLNIWLGKVVGIGYITLISHLRITEITESAPGPVGISRGDSWRVRAPVGVIRADSWDVRGVVGVVRSDTWRVRAPVGVARSDTWRVSVVPPLDAQAINSYLSEVHGDWSWSEEPPVGSVRVDHDYDAPDRFRVMRSGTGIGGVTVRAFPLESYRAGFRSDPGNVSGRSITGPDGRWEWDMYLVPGEYILVFDDQSRSASVEYLNVYVINDRVYNGPVPTPAGPYRDLDTVLSTAHGAGAWGPGMAPKGPSPIDHDYGGPGRFRVTRGGVGLGGTILEIYRAADFAAGRIGAPNRVGWSRSNAAGEWEWPVNLHPGTYTGLARNGDETATFNIEVS